MVTSPTQAKLEELVYYAADKASPYALAQFPQTSSLAQIAQLRLTQLAITPEGVAYMWLWINAHCMPFANPVDPATASKCETVGDVAAAVLKNVVKP